MYVTDAAGIIAETIIGSCQYPTKLTEYGLPAGLCGAPGVEYRPDRMFVSYVCENHR